MKSITTRFLIPVGGLTALLVAFATYRSFANARDLATHMMHQKAELALQFDLAIREYVAEHIRPLVTDLVDEDEFIPEAMSTSFVARSIFDKVRTKNPDYILKFASDNPRNPRNQAGPAELQMIDYFTAHPELEAWSGEIEIDGQPHIAHFAAMRVTKACLVCHGDPADAPKSLIERYGATASFHRPLGQIVGLDTVAIPVSATKASLASDTLTHGAFMAGVLVLLFAGTAILFRFLVSRRLSAISACFRHAAEESDTVQLKPVPIRRRDEIGALVASFNALVERINSTHSALEQRVAKRTSELAKHTQLLKDREERYRALFECSRDAIMTLAPPSWTFTSCNSAALDLFGAKDEAEFTSIGPWVVSPDSQPDGQRSADRARNMIETAMREGGHFFEWTHKRFHGEDFPTTVLLTRMKLGEQTFLQATVRDITAQKRAEADLAAANRKTSAEAAKLFAMIEGMEEGIVVANADDIITDVNTWFLDKTGLDRDHIIGKSLWEFHPDTEGTARLRTVLDKYRSGQQRETHVVTRELLGMKLILRAQPIVQDGAYSGAVLNVIDVTELVDAREAADAANAAKSQFLANMSHEIRTPMTAILGFAEVIRDELNCCGTCPSHATCEIRTSNGQNLDAICRNATYLLQVINDILDLSKIEYGNICVESIPTSPHAILASIASLMRPRAAEKGVVLSVCYAGAIPETIQSDPTRLQQAILNLVGNAIKFAEGGSVTLRAGLVGSQEAPELVVEVIDTGVGIPADRLQDIFEPFKQADSSTTRRFGGTGLGLTITKRIAGLLGGRLEVASEVGKGSVFTLRVATGPLDEVELLERPVEEVASQHHARRQGQTQPLNARVLLVEDGPDNRRLIAHILKKAGAEVDTAEDGRAGAKKALAARDHGAAYDVILMDMQMPVMDGYQATHYLRHEEYEGPIIALTAHAMGGDREKCIEAGCDDFASKPINREQLIETVRRYVQRGSGSVREPSAEQLAAIAQCDNG